MKVAFNISRVLVGLFALLYLVMGLQWLFTPETMQQQFAVLPNGILGWATMRADFGAFFLTAGITAVIGISKRSNAGAFLFCNCLLIGLAATGRIVGFTLDGIPEGGLVPFIFELCSLAAVVGYASLKQRLAASEPTP